MKYLFLLLLYIPACSPFPPTPSNMPTNPNCELIYYINRLDKKTVWGDTTQEIDTEIISDNQTEYWGYLCSKK